VWLFQDLGFFPAEKNPAGSKCSSKTVITVHLDAFQFISIQRIALVILNVPSLTFQKRAFILEVV